MSIDSSLEHEVFHPRDIVSQEQRMRIVLEGSLEPLKPVLANTLALEKKTLAILWRSVGDDQRYFFPISNPICKEFKYSNLSEWDVIFLGSFEQMMTTELTRHFKDVSSGPNKGIFCLLVVNHRITGFDGKDMSRRIFPCYVINRVEEGKLIIPKMFCDERWRPVRDRQNDILPAEALQKACAANPF